MDGIRLMLAVGDTKLSQLNNKVTKELYDGKKHCEGYTGTLLNCSGLVKVALSRFNWSQKLCFQNT